MTVGRELSGGPAGLLGVALADLPLAVDGVLQAVPGIFLVAACLWVLSAQPTDQVTRYPRRDAPVQLLHQLVGGLALSQVTTELAL